MTLTSAYYFLKPLIPRRVQIALRREVIRHRLSRIKNRWPIDEGAAKPPEGWRGWPEGKKFAVVLTHDVDTQLGHDKCLQLADLDESMGFRSSFNFVAEDYPVSADLLKNLSGRGFEIGSHGIHHSNPFLSREYFHDQALKINHYLKAWDAVGFRSPSMFRDAELLHELNIEYDASTFDTDPFEPQPEGVGTIFPFCVPLDKSQKSYAELPYTLPQDFFCFILMAYKDIGLWKQKLDWIADKGGMALFISHPDYMNFDGIRRSVTEYPVEYYRDFLTYITEKYRDQYWQVLPREMARFCAQNYSSIREGAVIDDKKKPRHLSRSSDELIEIDPLKDPRWDKFVETHPLGLICHLSGWKQVLEESFSHMKGHYLTLMNQDNSIRAAMPVFEVKSIFTGNRLVSIPFATNCDPLISSSEDMTELLDAAIHLSAKLGCSKIEIRTLLSSSLISDDRICRVVRNRTHTLSLKTDIDDLARTFSRQVRRKIRTPLQNIPEIHLAVNETELREFYMLYVKARKRLGLPPQPYIFFKSLRDKFSSGKHTSLLLFRYEQKLVAGLMMFTFKDRCSCEYLAVDSDFKKENMDIDYFAYWEAIKFACSEGYKILDFGRTGINNEGLMGFKKLWGTLVEDLPQIYYPKDLSLNSTSPEESTSYYLLRKISRNVPDSIFKLMGKILYQHLG